MSCTCEYVSMWMTATGELYKVKSYACHSIEALVKSIMKYFPVRKSSDSKQSRSLARPRSHKCNADNDVIIPPRFLSSRSSSSFSIYLSRRALVCIPFMSLSCTLRLVSPSSSSLVPSITHREFQRPRDRFTISIESNFFHGQQQRERERERTALTRTFTGNSSSPMLRRTMRFLLSAIPHSRVVCIYRGVYRSQLFQLSFPFFALSRWRLREPQQPGWNAKLFTARRTARANEIRVVNRCCEQQLRFDLPLENACRNKHSAL